MKPWKRNAGPGDGKYIEIETDTPSRVRARVDNDDVIPRDARMVAKAVERLPLLLEVEHIVKQMFDAGQLDAHPTSDASFEYRLKTLTKWRKAK